MAPRIDKPEPQPEPIKEVLSRLFAARGWGRRQGRLHLERAWAEAVGPDYEEHTRVLALKRGIFEIEVDSALLVQELKGYHKQRLLQALGAKLPREKIRELRFKVGNF
jgi:predicted nucleic acid-binding Zn ribbon protein